MTAFEFTCKHQFDISNHVFVYEPSNKIVVRDSEGVVQVSFNLNSETVAVKAEIHSGTMHFSFGSVVFNGPKFSKSIRLNENKPQLEFISENPGILGSDDLRDIRVGQHHYHLNEIPIELDSDGVFLNILCPGSESDPWYETT